MSLTVYARALRRRSTPAEKTLWYWLRHRYLNGYKFRRQHPIGRYILDFYCAELKLCIELDGRLHNTDAGAKRDDRRSQELSQRGITVIRFWNDDVRKEPDGCWIVIVETVEKLGRRERTAPHPDPLPTAMRLRRGEGNPGD